MVFFLHLTSLQLPTLSKTPEPDVMFVFVGKGGLAQIKRADRPVFVTPEINQLIQNFESFD